MLKQYMDIKKKHQNEILFFRMGDFYEMFFDDAKEASKILDIALTARQNNVPMCGIPYHAADNYISRLIKAGKRVAICEQMESVPSSGSIVRRDVVRIVTPGTVIEPNLLQSDDNNFLSSIIIDDNIIGMAFVDISTGDFFLTSIDKSMELFRGEITKFNPNEIVFKEGSSPEDDLFNQHITNINTPVYKINDWLYDPDYMQDLISETFEISGTKGLGITSDIDIVTAGSIIQYLKETHKRIFDHLKHPQKIITTDRMQFDDATISNLELTINQHDGTKRHTLFSVLNHTCTAMGRRKLEMNILQPLLDKNKIEKRLDIVQQFYDLSDITSQVRDQLKNINDMERLITRFSAGRLVPRNFIALAGSIDASSEVKKIITTAEHDTKLKELAKNLPDLKELSRIIKHSIEDDPALTPEQGRIIRRGFNPELDRLYELKTDAKKWILNYQEKEKKRLGINTLKIKYNKILGYYIEISKAQASAVGVDYFRKQTLVGSERYTTEKLQEFESEILSSSDKIITVEKKEIEKIRNKILDLRKQLQNLASAVGYIDFYSSLAHSAVENNFLRPEFNDRNEIVIKNGRHPIVEKYYTKEVFIPNDIQLNNNEDLIKIITGPNMSGKSTYIRMAAIIQLMAQTGSFVPAQKASLTVVDRIFTRIGASDNISRGESTFLVEMNETASILNNATDKSLIIMDEVGRGTSTYDGLSIAWAVVEYILRYLKAKTLFATHYHELTSLGNKKGIQNYNVMVKENLNSVDFLHKVSKGSAGKSYGIHVAKLAGIPGQITSRASRILEKLENTSKGGKNKFTETENSSVEQLEIFNASNHIVLNAIKNINIENLTPVDALNELNRLKDLID